MKVKFNILLYYLRLVCKFTYYIILTGKSIANGLVMNGSVTDSKINITSNPLAVLDTSDSTIQPKVRNSISVILRSCEDGSQGSRQLH